MLLTWLTVMSRNVNIGSAFLTLLIKLLIFMFLDYEIKTFIRKKRQLQQVRGRKSSEVKYHICCQCSVVLLEMH